MAVVLRNFAFGPLAAAANAERLTDKSRRAAVLQVYEKHDQSLKSTITARHLRVAALTLRADPSPHFLAHRVWNGIFGRRRQTRPTGFGSDVSKQRRRIGSHAREKRPQKRPFCRLRKPISKN
jgi:hypothetical protein